MPKTWENYECEFFTENTENKNGNSKYVVYKNKMTRNAPVNKERAPDQVTTGNPAVAYLDPHSHLYDKIMEQDDNDQITILTVSGDAITVMVSGLVEGTFTGNCTRKPANGLRPFDFSNDDGVLSGIHVGHEITQVTIGVSTGCCVIM